MWLSHVLVTVLPLFPCAFFSLSRGQGASFFSSSLSFTFATSKKKKKNQQTKDTAKPREIITIQAGQCGNQSKLLAHLHAQIYTQHQLGPIPGIKYIH
jgi:hypothetical protein